LLLSCVDLALAEFDTYLAAEWRKAQAATGLGDPNDLLQAGGGGHSSVSDSSASAS